MSEQMHHLHPMRLGLSLGIFLTIAYAACLALALIVPDRGLHQPWLQFFPGFSWTPAGIFVGIVESFGYGFFIGVIYGPIYNALKVATAR